MQSTCRLAGGVVLCLVYFWRGWARGVYVCVYVWICTHTHTLHVGHSMWAQGSGRDTWRTRRIQMDQIWHICICICVQSTHVYVFAGRRDEIWTDCFFPLTKFFGSEKAMQKMWTWKARTLIEIESELHRPSMKGTKLLIVIKAIIVIIFIINTKCPNHLDSLFVWLTDSWKCQKYTYFVFLWLMQYVRMMQNISLSKYYDFPRVYFHRTWAKARLQEDTFKIYFDKITESYIFAWLTQYFRTIQLFILIIDTTCQNSSHCQCLFLWSMKNIRIMQTVCFYNWQNILELCTQFVLMIDTTCTKYL